jgi:uncharacterized protein (TIGR03086 family)
LTLSLRHRSRLEVVDEVVELLDRALASTCALVDRLPDTALAQPSPCERWTVLDVVGHLAGVTEKFTRFANGERGTIRTSTEDLVGHEPAEPLRALADAAAVAWRTHPEALTDDCVLSFATFDGATAAGLNLLEAVVHRWDIATGAGLRVEITDAEAEASLAYAQVLVTDAARAADQFGPAPRRPATGPPLDRLLATVGRT